MALDANALATLIVNNMQTEFGEIQPRGQEGLQKMANAIASAIVTHLTSSAEVRITTSDGGLQRDPASSDPTLAPTSTQTLGIT